MSNETLSAEELGNKLLQSVKEMKAGKAARVSRVEPNQVAEVGRRTMVAWGTAVYTFQTLPQDLTLGRGESGEVVLTAVALKYERTAHRIFDLPLARHPILDAHGIHTGSQWAILSAGLALAGRAAAI